METLFKYLPLIEFVLLLFATAVLPRIHNWLRNKSQSDRLRLGNNAGRACCGLLPIFSFLFWVFVFLYLAIIVLGSVLGLVLAMLTLRGKFSFHFEGEQDEWGIIQVLAVALFLVPVLEFFSSVWPFAKPKHLIYESGRKLISPQEISRRVRRTMYLLAFHKTRWFVCIMARKIIEQQCPWQMLLGTYRTQLQILAIARWIMGKLHSNFRMLINGDGHKFSSVFIHFHFEPSNIIVLSNSPIEETTSPDIFWG